MNVRRLKVGVILPTYRRLATVENICLAAQLSESLGFDSVWVTDHVVVPSSSLEAFGPTFYEAVTVMSYVAAITSRVQIGAAILIVPYRHPLLLAKMLATADQLSGGRMILGAGLGWLESESTLMGVPHNRRARIADEALGAIRACWESDQPEFHGDAYDLGGFHFAPRPHANRRLPIYVGGASTAALRRAALFGDGWIGDGQTFEELEVALEQLARELEARGRAVGEVEIAMRTGLQVAANRTAITESPSEQGWKSAEFVTAGRTPFRGVREEVVADFRRAAELGVGHLVFEFPVSKGEESMALFEALAEIREEAGV
ncbi:MAG: TIGR03619 family F420-dependent LLM class oxidoreductase [Candidatus Dormibacteraceae bacterium]